MQYKYTIMRRCAAFCCAMQWALADFYGRFFVGLSCWKRERGGGQSKEIRAAKAALLPLTDGKIRCGRPEQGRRWDKAKTNACCRLQNRNPLQIMKCWWGVTCWGTARAQFLPSSEGAGYQLQYDWGSARILSRKGKAQGAHEGLKQIVVEAVDHFDGVE